jgi:hypothetical protein
VCTNRSLSTLFLCSLVISCIHAFPVSVIRVDDPLRPGRQTMCTADGQVCVAEFNFQNDTRIIIEVNATYALGVEITPVRTANGCEVRNDLYVAKAPNMFAANSLAAFMATPSFAVVFGHSRRDGLLATTLGACDDQGPTVRFVLGIHRVNRGESGLCDRGVFRLRLDDGSVNCGFRREDQTCYKGDLACRGDTGDLVGDYAEGEPTRCCPYRLDGQPESILLAPTCTCAGKDRTQQLSTTAETSGMGETTTTTTSLTTTTTTTAASTTMWSNDATTMATSTSASKTSALSSASTAASTSMTSNDATTATTVTALSSASTLTLPQIALVVAWGFCSVH